MRVLCVAEKPSIARSITAILSGGQFQTRLSPNKFIKNFDFDYPQTNSLYTVTSVSGHLTTHDFSDALRQWHSCDPFVLFDAPIETKIPPESKTIEKNLMNEAKRAEILMIWTDCDREGEHIGSEIANVCRKAKRNIVVKRARFSAIIAQQIHHAAQHPVELDRAQADAVDARIRLDLRIGAAFTRMQTLALQGRFAQLNEKREPVSYGPCQFPTLGFVVSRYSQVKSFTPETFQYIFLALSRQNSSSVAEETQFSWRRGHLFEFGVAVALYEHVLSDPVAKIVKVVQKPTKKWKPLPLTTVELQKSGSRLLKLAPKKLLDIAEKLYQQGFLSYPRTETDQFDPQFDHKTLIHKQTADPAWGAFAIALEQNFNAPRRGKKNDKAHPPIHPTAFAANLVGDEKRVYEYITRRYLACCSKDAEGWEKTVEVECGGEKFSASGLTILARNYLEVYIYDKWNGKEIPDFEEGEEFMPSVCELREGQTSCPSYLTEADLVTLMDKNGIGTDATIAQHIQTIVDREYVIERMEGATKYLIPSTLGIGLIEGYNQIGFDKSLSKPQLRRETERNMVRICQGTKTKNEMLTEGVEQYKDMFIRAKGEFGKVVASVRKYIEGNGVQGGGGGGGGGDNGGGGNGGGGNGGGGGRGARGGGRGRGASRGGNDSASARGRGRGGRGGGAGGARAPSPPPFNDVDEDFFNDSPPPPAPPVPPPRSRPPPPPPVSNSAAIREVRCHCDIPAAERTVLKESVSKGKQFYTCGNSGTCHFFEWKDGPIASGSKQATPVVPAKRTYTDHSRQEAPANNAGPSRQCICNEEAVQRTVGKEGPNKGRLFWACSKPKDAGCGFFEWDDEPPRNVGGGGASSAAGTSQGGGRSSGECFKCGQSGHWASACTDGGGGAPKRARSFGSKTDNPTPGECFKCGQSGHWSNVCPNGDGAPPAPSVPASRGGSKRGRSSTRGIRGGKSGSKRGGKSKTKRNTFGAPDD